MGKNPDIYDVEGITKAVKDFFEHNSKINDDQFNAIVESNKVKVYKIEFKNA